MTPAQLMALIEEEAPRPANASEGTFADLLLFSQGSFSGG